MTTPKGFDDFLQAGGSLADTRDIPISDPEFDKERKERRKKQLHHVVLAQRIASEAPLIYSGGSFYAWRKNALGGAYYALLEDKAIGQALFKIIGTDFKKCLEGEVENTLKAMTCRRTDELNAGQDLNLLNGVFDVAAKSLRPSTTSDIYTAQLQVRYDPAAQCPTWRRVVSDVLEGREDDINTLQAFAGYSLTRTCKSQKCLLMVGSGSNGKGTITDTLLSIFGSDNAVALSLESFKNDGFTGLLFGKLLNVATESSSKSVDWSERFKTAVAGETLMSNQKYKPQFFFRPFAKHIITMNDMPYLEDKSDGTTRRFIVIECTRKFDGDEKNMDINAQLASERDGIFNWMLDGLDVWTKAGGNFDKIMTDRQKAIISAYKVDSDPFLSFIEDECDLMTDDETSAHDLYAAYLAYCQKSGFKGTSIKKFGGRLSRTLKLKSQRVKVNGKTKLVYLGIVTDSTVIGNQSVTIGNQSRPF